MKPTLLIGPPGTGKTHTLVNKVVEMKPDRFAFVSFTRRAASEAKQRLKDYYKSSELNNVQTIHSLCFNLLGLRTAQVMDWKHLRQFGNEYGYQFRGRNYSLEDDSYNYLSDDDVQYREMLLDVVRLKGPSSDMWTRYLEFKKTNHLIDFNDMLIKACKEITIPKFDLVCVDEIQDLTPLQLSFIFKVADKAGQVIYAGDGNQMIFEWAGVDRKAFIDLNKECDVEILTTQYRIPPDIYSLACKTVGLINTKYPSHTGNIIYDHVSEFKKDESYLILARNGYLLNRIARELEEQNIKWVFLNQFESKLHSNMFNVKLSTIHAAKGAEADNVILCTDVSPATYENIDTDMENRVWYVAITRARKKLYLVPPETDYFYELT